TAPPAAAASSPAEPSPPPGASIAGTWTAQPVAGTSIVLSIQPGGQFTWAVTQKGQKKHYSGASSYGDGILTLAQDNGTPLVGHVGWKDTDHMTFHVVGEGPEDAGLSFSKG